MKKKEGSKKYRSSLDNPRSRRSSYISANNDNFRESIKRTPSAEAAAVDNLLSFASEHHS